jgi:hypothetical protein
MGLWADMMKVMKSKLFADTLKDGDYEIKTARGAPDANGDEMVPAKAFTFYNQTGFGAVDENAEGFWMLWNKERTINNQSKLICDLLPTTSNQDLGSSSYYLRRMWGIVGLRKMGRTDAIYTAGLYIIVLNDGTTDYTATMMVTDANLAANSSTITVYSPLSGSAKGTYVHRAANGVLSIVNNNSSLAITHIYQLGGL